MHDMLKLVVYRVKKIHVQISASFQSPPPCLFVYLRRQQERDLMQKARRLMDENSVSFQTFLILLSSITLGSESQIPVFKEGQGNI